MAAKTLQHTETLSQAVPLLTSLMENKPFLVSWLQYIWRYSLRPKACSCDLSALAKALGVHLRRNMNLEGDYYLTFAWLDEVIVDAAHFDLESILIMHYFSDCEKFGYKRLY